MNKFSLDVRVNNLKELLTPIPEQIKFPELDTAEFLQKVNAHHNVLKSYQHRKSQSKQCLVHNATDKAVQLCCENNIIDNNIQFANTPKYICALFDGEEKLWYPGIVTKYVKSEFCEACKCVREIFNSAEYFCFAKFFTLVYNDVFELVDTHEYHVHPVQLVLSPKVEYVKLVTNNVGIKFSTVLPSMILCTRMSCIYVLRAMGKPLQNQFENRKNQCRNVKEK